MDDNGIYYTDHDFITYGIWAEVIDTLFLPKLFHVNYTAIH